MGGGIVETSRNDVAAFALPLRAANNRMAAFAFVVLLLFFRSLTIAFIGVGSTWTRFRRCDLSPIRCTRKYRWFYLPSSIAIALAIRRSLDIILTDEFAKMRA